MIDGQEPEKTENRRQKRFGRGMYRRSVICLKIAVFSKSRAGEIAEIRINGKALCGNTKQSRSNIFTLEGLKNSPHRDIMFLIYLCYRKIGGRCNGREI